MKAPIPSNEEARLEALRRYHLLDTAPEQAFDDIVKLASYICDTPIAMVSLVDKERQWFKAKVGVDTTETHRDHAFCAHAILQKSVLVVEDALEDERFADSELVTHQPKIRFYAGAPLTTSDGLALGALCVGDREPHVLTPEQETALVALSRLTVNQMELRRVSEDLAKTVGEMKTLNGLLPVCAWCKKIRTDDGCWEQLESYIRTHTDADFSHGICPECMQKEWKT